MTATEPAMRFLGRLLLGAFALVLAIPAGAATLALGVLLDPASREAIGGIGLAGVVAGLSDMAEGIGPETMLFALAAFARALFVLLAVPPALAGLVGGIAGWRAMSWYGAATGALTAFMPWLARGMPRTGLDAQALALEGRITAILFLTGAASGLVYWLVAGRGTPHTGQAASR